VLIKVQEAHLAPLDIEKSFEQFLNSPLIFT